MFWLASQIWILLIAAFALGLGIGWWIWGAHTHSAKTTADNGAETGSLTLDGEALAPLLYPEPIHGSKDTLTDIIGVDNKTVQQLNEIGVYYIAQIAVWDRQQIKWIENKLKNPGRIHRERWVDQAATLQNAAAAE